jgi:hypothetical protein
MNKKASGIIQNAAAQAGNNGRRIRFLDPSLSEIRERGIELADSAYKNGRRAIRNGGAPPGPSQVNRQVTYQPDIGSKPPELDHSRGPGILDPEDMLKSRSLNIS